MSVSAKDVKALRDRTGAGMMDCKKALQETGGDMEAAVDYLRSKGAARAAKRAEKAANEGTVGHYIHHGGRIGVLVEVNCETDFVARNDSFLGLVRDIAMHIAAASPLAVTAEGIPADVVERERAIFRDQVRNEGKPEQIRDKIVEGKLRKFYQEHVLLEQPYVKDPDITVRELIERSVAQTGENIVVRRFARFAVGE
jgi:elongation factor Ts